MEGKIYIYAALAAAYYGYKFFVKKQASRQESKQRLNQETVSESKGPFANRRVVSETAAYELAEEYRKEEKRKGIVLEDERPVYRSLEMMSGEEVSSEIEDVNPYLQYKPIVTDSVSVKRMGGFEEYQQVKKVNPFAALFADKSKVKEAFIMGEILKKKSEF